MFARLAPLPSNRIADPHRRELNMDSYYCSILPSPLQCTLAILGLKNSRGQKPDLKLSANELHANADNGQVSKLAKTGPLSPGRC